MNNGSGENQFTIKQVAEITGRNQKTIRRWIQAGKIAYKLVDSVNGPTYLITQLPPEYDQLINPPEPTIEQERANIQGLIERTMNRLERLVERLEKLQPVSDKKSRMKKALQVRVQLSSERHEYARQVVKDQPGITAEKLIEVIKYKYDKGIRRKDALAIIREIKTRGNKVD